MMCVAKARMPLINSAYFTPSKLTDVPVIRLPIDIPQRIASMNKLMVLPCCRAATVVCNSEFTIVLLTAIEVPARTSKMGNPQSRVGALQYNARREGQCDISAGTVMD
jgi:hypothetical protein